MSRVARPDFQGVPLDTRTIPQDRLNIDNKERCNLFPWNGQFSPQLIEQLIQTYATNGGLILDPFLGSGTVLHEAGRLGFPAFGAEINPAAFKMAETYRLINVNPTRRRHILESVSDLLDDLTPDAAPLFARSKPRHEDRPICEVLAREAAGAADPFAGRLLEALLILLDVGRREIDHRTIRTTWSKVREIVSALPFSNSPIELANCDARSLPLSSEQVDFVVTSPPYINVFNYHQQYRKSVEVMAWDLLEVARSEIGSNRKHRGNRFLTVIQYCLDMQDVFRELRRVCKPNAEIIIVVGRESQVRKTVFFNGEIVAGLAVRCAGFAFRSRQERVFQNRFGEMIYEDILHFTLRPLAECFSGSASDFAKEILSAAFQRAPSESENDLRDAIDRIADVAPSSMYHPEAAQADGRARQVV
jgi:SAM-dependent methyltransferase